MSQHKSIQIIILVDLFVVKVIKVEQFVTCINYTDSAKYLVEVLGQPFGSQQITGLGNAKSNTFSFIRVD